MKHPANIDSGADQTSVLHPQFSAFIPVHLEEWNKSIVKFCMYIFLT